MRASEGPWRVGLAAAGRTLDDPAFDVNPAGFVVPGAMHGVGDDAGRVRHTHTFNGMSAWPCRRIEAPAREQSLEFARGLGANLNRPALSRRLERRNPGLDA